MFTSKTLKIRRSVSDQGLSTHHRKATPGKPHPRILLRSRATARQHSYGLKSRMLQILAPKIMLQLLQELIRISPAMIRISLNNTQMFRNIQPGLLKLLVRQVKLDNRNLDFLCLGSCCNLVMDESGYGVFTE